MIQIHILLLELNRHYYCSDDSKVKEKKFRFFRGLTEYIPSICQLVKVIHANKSRFYLDQLFSAIKTALQTAAATRNA